MLLMIKCYPGTDVILSKYKDEHDHLLSDGNLQDWNIVMDMVYLRIDSKAIVSHSGATVIISKLMATVLTR